MLKQRTAQGPLVYEMSILCSRPNSLEIDLPIPNLSATPGRYQTYDVPSSLVFGHDAVDEGEYRLYGEFGDSQLA